eukprot:TRINITY_DN4266_c0_g1_i1.p1 TRINITY_DN4266_c0_g1~~TRINITY_DN4266_c0_g1_i1.p1  ORF type:complete len:744 (+),score=237.46 TRINITY_DN4266_c0_g1_i1:147-2378(+)
MLKQVFFVLAVLCTAGMASNVDEKYEEVGIHYHQMKSTLEKALEGFNPDEVDELFSLSGSLPKGVSPAEYGAALLTLDHHYGKDWDKCPNPKPKFNGESGNGLQELTDLLYLDTVKDTAPAAVDPQVRVEKVEKYKQQGKELLKRARAVGQALSGLVRGTANIASAKMQHFKRQLAGTKVDSRSASAFAEIAREAERVSGSVIRLGRGASVVGYGRTDARKAWDVFKEIASEVKRQSQRQIYNAGVKYLQLYGHPSTQNPVVLIPGFGGTRLQARLTNGKDSNPCRLNWSKYDDFWLSSSTLFRYLTNSRTQGCVYDILSLKWNGNSFKQNPRYRVRAVDGTIGVDLLDHGVASSLSEYFNPLITALETIGYQRDHDVVAFGYDWRYGPNTAQMKKTFDAWFDQIEEMVAKFAKPVSIVAHSMGNNHFLELIKRANADPNRGPVWIKKHIGSYVSVGGTFAGSPKMIESLISGTNFAMPFFNKKAAGRMLGSFGTSAWVLPTVQGYGSRTLLSIRDEGKPTKRYSAINMRRLLRDSFQASTQAHYHKLAKNMYVPEQLISEVHSYYGTDIPTSVAFEYEKVYDHRGTFKRLRQLATRKSNGDGSVPTRSSKFLCKNWKNVHCRAFSRVNHRELLWHLPLVTEVLEIATGLRTTKGLTIPLANPVRSTDADGHSITNPGFEDGPDVGMPSDVDGRSAVWNTAPGSPERAEPTVKRTERYSLQPAGKPAGSDESYRPGKGLPIDN